MSRYPSQTWGGVQADFEREEVHGLVEEIIAVAAGSIENLAEEAGVSYAALYGWASGRRNPTAENLLALAKVADRRSDSLRELAASIRALAKGEEEHPGPLP